MKKRFTEAQIIGFLKEAEGGLPIKQLCRRHGFSEASYYTCLNEHWFTSLAHAQAVIETWRREYNEERPKRGLGGLTPAAYARQLVGPERGITPGL